MIHDTSRHTSRDTRDTSRDISLQSGEWSQIPNPASFLSSLALMLLLVVVKTDHNSDNMTTQLYYLL